MNTERVLQKRFLECLLIERHGETQEVVDDVWVVVELLVDHEGKNAHLGGTTVIEFNRQLLLDGRLVPLRSCQLSLLDLLLPVTKPTLNETDEENNLEGTIEWDLVHCKSEGFEEGR